VQEIGLAPLAREDLGRLIADTLSCTPPVAAPLARLVHEKTGGNPFFAIQFISALAEEGLLDFDHDAARWRWELDRVHAKGYTDNVADLMVGKLTRPAVETQEALQQLACLGNVAEITMLSIVLGNRTKTSVRISGTCVRLELVEDLEARTSSSTTVSRRPPIRQYRNGCAPKCTCASEGWLAAHIPAERREESVFEIVNPAQPRRRLNRLTRRAGAAGRIQPARGPARQGLCRLRLGAHLSHRRCGPVAGRTRGSAGTSSPLRWSCIRPNASSSPSRWRKRSSAWRRCRPAPQTRWNEPRSRACAWICTRPSIRAAAPLPSARLSAASGHRLVAASDE